jgi:cyanophycinase
VADRAQAAEPQVAAILQEATGIFFTGGDQLRITAVLGGTAGERAIRRAHLRGAVVAGTSAGASAMSSTMIVGGRSDASPRREIVRMSPGLGLLPELVIDQHFAQRGRLSRLLAAVGQNPGLLGIGVDEDTAFVVDDADILTVVGSATVTVLDGRGVRLTSASETDLEQPLTLSGVMLHVLADGYAYDLRTRRALAPAE